MTDDIPEWIEDRLEFDPGKEVQDSHIVRVFLDSDRPYLTRKQVENEIGLSSQETRDRLLDLEERGLLRSEAAGGGRIYWIDDEKSAWPIPPDVEVEPVTDELTVAEVFSRQPVQFAAVGILVMIAGALLTTLFVVALAYDISLVLFETEQLLLWAIMAVFVGIAFCFGGLTVWAMERVRHRIEHA